MKIALIPADIKDLKQLITFAFEDDADLIQKYSHLGVTTLEASVNKNYETIMEMANDVMVFKIVCDDPYVTIGFTVIKYNEEFPQHLVSFGINIHYRTQKSVLKWLAEVRELLGKFFYTSLYLQNTRAIDFFCRNGFTKVEQPGENFVLLFRSYKSMLYEKQKIENLLSHGG